MVLILRLREVLTRSEAPANEHVLTHLFLCLHTTNLLCAFTLVLYSVTNMSVNNFGIINSVLVLFIFQE